MNRSSSGGVDQRIPLDETYDRFVGEQADVLGLKNACAARGTVIGGYNANADLYQLENDIDPNYACCARADVSATVRCWQ